MEITPQIYTAKMMHKRLFPKVNSFTYGIYYLALPLSNITGISHNKFSLLSFYDKDHGAKDGSALDIWVKNILIEHNLGSLTDEVMLITMPRVLGYVFNPVSFWLCLDKEKQLRAVLCEVNNTFGETHNYLCTYEDHRIITSDDWLKAKKLFHVSPFLKREGYYKFRFSIKDNQLGIWIDFYNKDHKKQLITSLIGTMQPLNSKNLRKTFRQHPLITLKTIFLIHWQALKIIAKGIKYIPKPLQIKQRISISENIKEM